MAKTKREQLIQKAAYPSFLEGPGRSCRRIILIEEKKIVFDQMKSLLVPPDCLVQFGEESGTYQEMRNLLEPGDWLGLEFGPLRKLCKITLLSPHLKEVRQPLVTRQTLEEWNLFQRTVRRFFDHKGFLEVQTPTLVRSPGTEPHLDFFETKFKKGRAQKTLYFPTSPELHLKKLLAAGYGPLYEIKTCFRNGEISDIHQPEFQMLEWYRPAQDLQKIQKDCVALVKKCAAALKKKGPKKIEICTMAELFFRHLGFALKPSTKPQELRALAFTQGLSPSLDSDFDDLFYLLFIEKIEPRMNRAHLVFVFDYPPSQAALARLTPEGWGDRFEMYWSGMELANAYHELNDPKIQRRRSNEDLQKRQQLGKFVVPLDEGFFSSLDAGMPPSAGIALGLERLFLAMTGRKKLAEIRLFPMTEET